MIHISMKKIILSLFASLLFTGATPALAQEVETLVLIETSKGKIKVKLYNETPLHRDNFIKLVKEGTYDGLLFHRIIKQFMVQGGDVTSKDSPPEEHLGDGDMGYTIPAEFVYPRYFHKRGALCAARNDDEENPTKASSGSQFYIVTGKHFTSMELDKKEKEENITFTPEQRKAYMIEGGAPHLDNEYTVFGEVVKGIKVADKIQFVLTNEEDRPLKNIIIERMTIVKK